MPQDLQELTDRVVNIAWQTSVYNPRLPQFSRSASGFTAEERENLKVSEFPGGYNKSEGTVAELLWKRSSTELTYQLDWIKMKVNYPADPEFVPGQPFRITLRFEYGTKTANDIHMSWRLPEGWSCVPQTQYLFITYRNGESVFFDLIPPEDAKALDYAEFIVGRNGNTCDDIIKLPLQLKGSSHATLMPALTQVFDRGLLNTKRCFRKLDLP